MEEDDADVAYAEIAKVTALVCALEDWNRYLRRQYLPNHSALLRVVIKQNRQSLANARGLLIRMKRRVKAEGF